MDLEGALSALAAHRPVFHSERDFQHVLAWRIQLARPQAQIRLETRQITQLGVLLLRLPARTRAPGE